jgi:PKD repeat protein
MKKIFYVILFIILASNIKSQITYYRDIFCGGVSVAGISTADALGSRTIPVNISPNGVIRKVFLVAYAQIGYNYDVDDVTFYINSIPVTLSRNSDWYIFVENNLEPFQYIGHRTHVKDITNLFSSNFSSVTFDWTTPQNTPTDCPACRYGAPLIVVLYEDNSMGKVNYELILNNKPNQHSSQLIINNMNPSFFENDIGLGIHSDRLGWSVTDGYYFHINNQYAGSLFQTDSSSIASGVIGNYYFKNDTMYGLTDDVANSTFEGSDGILLLNDYCNNTLENTIIQFDYILQSANVHNSLIGLNLTYTTPCDTFSTTLTDNVNVCKGAQAQLNATGGSTAPLSHPAYEWLPEVGLSCYNCPNPIVTADTINYYTCRIWNTDSCSKVLPVKINILPLPQEVPLAITDATCGQQDGRIVVTQQPDFYTYSLNGGPPQSTLQFNNLGTGSYALQIATSGGCSIDTTVYVDEITNVVAQFTASPTSGDVPLSVNFTNQSANATNYSWYIQNDTLTTPQASHNFDTSGVYTVTLVAYNTYPHCADTAKVTIVAEYPFTIIAPSLFVSDENYTPYQIYTSGVKELHYELFTDQGKLVYSKVLMPSTGNSSLWNSNQLAKGIYLYRIWAMDEEGVEKVITGKVVVI